MGATDDLVNAWLKDKFLKSDDYHPVKHGEHDEVSVVKVDMGWDCYCYSSWTRDDTFVLTAKLKGVKGEFEYQYGYWGQFPDFIEELDEYKNNNTCYYESPEYDG